VGISWISFIGGGIVKNNLGIRVWQAVELLGKAYRGSSSGVRVVVGYTWYIRVYIIRNSRELIIYFYLEVELIISIFEIVISTYIEY
jgi:hypothetical protein